jgi:hypothetical protein
MGEKADAGAGEGKATRGKGRRKQGGGEAGGDNDSDESDCTAMWNPGEYFGEQGLLVPLGEAFSLRYTAVAGELGLDTTTMHGDEAQNVKTDGTAHTELLEFGRADFLQIEADFPAVGARLREQFEDNPSFASRRTMPDGRTSFTDLGWVRLGTPFADDTSAVSAKPARRRKTKTKLALSSEPARTKVVV